MVFLSCFRQFTDQGSRRAEIISEIRAQLERCKQEQQFEVKFEISRWENPRVLSFSLASQTMLDQSVDFDVLPAFDALGEKPRRSTEKGEHGGRAARGSAEVVHPFTSQALRTCVLIPTFPQSVWRKGHLLPIRTKVLHG